MTSWLDWGIRVVLWFQEFSPTLDLPFVVLPFLGDEKFFMSLLPLLYWCVDRHTGARVSMLLLLSSYVNALAKDFFAQPRPFEYDPHVRQLVTASGEGLPSGHTQVTVVFWGYLSAQVRRTWLWIVAVFLMIFVPLSRIYVGNHFPTDLLGGYVLGAVILLLYRWLAPLVEHWLIHKGLRWQWAGAVVVPVLLILAAGGDQNSVTAGTMLMGISAGIVLERHWLGFDTSGPVWQRAGRFLVGAAGLAVLFGVLHVVFKDAEPALLFRVLRYGLVGLWIGCGAPWVFVAFGLASTRQREASP
jgi:membrane-associated phospholipid phosphatase